MENAILSEENGRLVTLVQACLGLISPRMIRISLQIQSSGGTALYFLLERDSELDRELIDDIVGDFEAMEGALNVDVVVLLRGKGDWHATTPGRPVFQRWEPADADAID